MFYIICPWMNICWCGTKPCFGLWKFLRFCFNRILLSKVFALQSKVTRFKGFGGTTKIWLNKIPAAIQSPLFIWWPFPFRERAWHISAFAWSNKNVFGLSKMKTVEFLFSVVSVVCLAKVWEKCFTLKKPVSDFLFSPLCASLMSF